MVQPTKYFFSRIFFPSLFFYLQNFTYRWRNPYSVSSEFLYLEAQMKRNWLTWYIGSKCSERCVKKAYGFERVCFWRIYFKIWFKQTVFFKVATIWIFEDICNLKQKNNTSHNLSHLLFFPHPNNDWLRFHGFLFHVLFSF